MALSGLDQNTHCDFTQEIGTSIKLRSVAQLKVRRTLFPADASNFVSNYNIVIDSDDNKVSISKDDDEYAEGVKNDMVKRQKPSIVTQLERPSRSLLNRRRPPMKARSENQDPAGKQDTRCEENPNGALKTNTELLRLSKKNQKDKSKLKTALRKANLKITQLRNSLTVTGKTVQFRKSTKTSKEDKDDDWKDRWTRLR